MYIVVRFLASCCLVALYFCLHENVQNSSKRKIKCFWLHAVNMHTKLRFCHLNLNLNLPLISGSYKKTWKKRINEKKIYCGVLVRCDSATEIKKRRETLWFILMLMNNKMITSCDSTQKNLTRTHLNLT